MTDKQFLYYLKGFMENSELPTKEQWDSLKTKVKRFLDKVPTYSQQFNSPINLYKLNNGIDIPNGNDKNTV